MAELPRSAKFLVPDSLRDSSLARGAVTAGLVLLGSRWLLDKVSNYKEAREMGKKRELAQDLKKKSIADVEEIIRNDPEAIKNKNIITKISPLELVDKIKKGEYTALQVLRAYQAKALDCQEKTNAICYFFEEAELWARECDANPVKKGKFFGLPISIKDHFNVKGYDAVYGVSRNIGHPAEEDSLFIVIMRREGAVPFARTNVPQLMMTFESSNPVFGVTKNPIDPTRGPGGSSGGEGAIVGYGASPLGLGSDIAGSVRVPAAFCGCCGFKPTTYRMSKRGNPPFDWGQTAIDETFGPLAPDVDTIVEVCKALWDHEQMFEADTKIPKMLFDHKLFEMERPLRIGMYIDLGTQNPIPAVYRSMEMAKAALEAEGHTIVPWTPPNADQAYEHFRNVVFADGGRSLTDSIPNDILDPTCASTIGNLFNPKWYKLFKAYIQNFYDTKASMETRTGAGINVGRYWEAYHSIQKYRDAASDSWQAARLDACIGPVFPFPAMPLLRTGSMSSEDLYWGNATYTLIYNVLCQPAGVVPVTKVTSEDVVNMRNYPKKTKVDRAIHTGMKCAEGLPIPCQVIALRFRDEMVLKVMKELESGLKQFK